ncbi:MAG: nuclear transport factor 2 family protein [Saprospiraceae bacterium]|nr:nuclear transport factor 2 family protein [Saprospiraceae bacterium]
MSGDIRQYIGGIGSIIFWLIVLFFAPRPVLGQAADSVSNKVYAEIMQHDSLLFKLGYNQCDTATVRKLMAESFEFYHDQAGAIYSKDDFLKSLAALCTMDYKATRELDEKKSEVHLLRKNGDVYGALQSGYHSFYGEKQGVEKYITSRARFQHLWIKCEGEWRLKRVISYDHRAK